MIFNKFKKTLFKNNFSVLDFPYPYKGMLSFSSDVEFTSWDTQEKLIEFFGNLGLEISFSYWAYADYKHTWCLFDKNNKFLPYTKKALFFASHNILDTLHSFGGITDGKGTFLDRSRFLNTYNVLEQHNIKTKIYTNHGSTRDTQNIGGGNATYQKGDDPDHPHYHLDLTLRHGVRFFWTDIDYDNQRSFFNLENLFKMTKAQDGNEIICFKRFRGNLDFAPTLTNFKMQLNLIEPIKEGYSIIYQHFGAKRQKDGKPVRACQPYFDEDTKIAFLEFLERTKNKDFMITSSLKLLNHARLHLVKPWNILKNNNKIIVSLETEKTYKGRAFDFELSDFMGLSVKTQTDLDVEFILQSTTLKSQVKIVDNEKITYLPWKKTDFLEILDASKSII